MIEPRKVSYVKENVDFMKSQLELLKKRITEENKIEPKENTADEERARIIAILDSHIAKLPNILNQVKDINSKEDLKNIKNSDFIKRLQIVDETVNAIMIDVAAIIKEQVHSKLENYKREVVNSAYSIMGLFDFVIPNIHNEIVYFKRFYRIPSNAGNTILPELEELLANLNSHKISLNDFMNGYMRGKEKVEGYDQLRTRNNVFSKFQAYENTAEDYDKLNICILNICRFIMPFLSEQRTEPAFAKLFSQMEEIYRKAQNPKLGLNINAMKDIFELSALFHTMIIKVGKKYSYREEFKNAKTKVSEFNDLQKAVIFYNEEVYAKHEEIFVRMFKDESPKAMFERINGELKRCMAEKILPFDRIEMVFSKLLKKDFNVVVMEKEADDLTIQITPHLAKKFGEDNLKRINIIILEIDFWFPHEIKQLMFEELAGLTQKIQVDEPIDNKEFMKMMQDFNKEIDEKYRKLYPDQIKLVSHVVNSFLKIFGSKKERDLLNSRLMDKNAWDEASARTMKVKRNLAVLASDHESLKSNINKFPFLKSALEDICQLLYDTAMQLFITYDLADQRSVLNMTNILSVYNEFHDVKSLWHSFHLYFQQKSISNFYSNETKTIRLTNNFLCKTELEKLFPQKKQG